MVNSIEAIKKLRRKIEIPRAARAVGAKTWSNFAHAKLGEWVHSNYVHFRPGEF